MKLPVRLVQLSSSTYHNKYFLTMYAKVIYKTSKTEVFKIHHRLSYENTEKIRAKPIGSLFQASPMKLWSLTSKHNSAKQRSPPPFVILIPRRLLLMTNSQFLSLCQITVLRPLQLTMPLQINFNRLLPATLHLFRQSYH